MPKSPPKAVSKGGKVVAFPVLTMGVTLANRNQVRVDIADEASGQAHSLDGTS